MENKDIAKEWFCLAEMDYNSALFLTGMHPVPIEIICYHCRQCAEKYLKGFLAWSGEEIVRTHDLTELNKICKRLNATFAAIEEKCLKLTVYGVNIRYPYPLDILESDMRHALQDAVDIMNFVNALIK